jgi:hypothetical protein
MERLRSSGLKSYGLFPTISDLRIEVPDDQSWYILTEGLPPFNIQLEHSPLLSMGDYPTPNQAIPRRYHRGTISHH